LNEKWAEAFLEWIARGMLISKGTDDFDITIAEGSWLCDGVLIRETAEQEDLLTLDGPDDHDRIDVVYGEFAYEADTDPDVASYHVLKGTPGDVPVEPIVSSGQVKLAAIYIPLDASTLDDCQIMPAYCQTEQLEMLFGIKIENNIWRREEGDPWLTSGNPDIALIREYRIRDGDLWVDLGGLDLYIYDAAANEWVPSDVVSHGSTHRCGNSDPLDIKDLCDILGYRHLATQAAHDNLHLNHAQLSNVTADQHHSKSHAAKHELGGEDELDVKDLADEETYLHKHAAGVKHGNEEHDPLFSEVGHDHVLADLPEEIISRGWIGWDTAPSLACQVGDSVWVGYMTNLELAGTKVFLDELHVFLAAGPSASISYVVRLNGASIGTVTVGVGVTHASTVLGEPLELNDDDAVRLDAPADVKSAAGLVFRGTIYRQVGAVGGGE